MQTNNETEIKSNFWIVNDLYGGYSTKGSNYTGSADYVPAEKVIALAKAQNDLVHLASGRWEILGMKGYGETVNPERALELVKEYKKLTTGA